MLTESLKETWIELVSTSEVPEMIALLKQKTFDLVLVDNLAEHHEAVCHHIRDFEDIPLVLIVNTRKADWKRLQQLGADYFLPEGARKDELIARLRVMWRYSLLPDRLRKSLATWRFAFQLRSEYG